MGVRYIGVGSDTGIGSGIDIGVGSGIGIGSGISIGVGNGVFKAGGVFSFVLLFFFFDSPRCFVGQECVFLLPRFFGVGIGIRGGINIGIRVSIGVGIGSGIGIRVGIGIGVGSGISIGEYMHRSSRHLAPTAKSTTRCLPNWLIF